MSARFEFLLRQGDTALVLGQRLSEWCGRGPALEEDIALANTALDYIGQAQLWLSFAGEVEGRGRSADDLAYFRDAWDFRNLLLAEQPNRDFGHTIMRQYLFDAYQVLNLEGIANGSDARADAIAGKALKEALYHLERSREIVIALGDGTEISHTRMQDALDRLWPFALEMFCTDPVDAQMVADGVIPDPDSLRPLWDAETAATFQAATLTVPKRTFAHQGGKTGTRHSEHLGHLLATMQVLPRSYPDATW